MEYTGSIRSIKPTQIVSDKFSKREFTIINEDEQYPQTIQFELQQTKCDTIDSFKLGDKVRVSFNLRGREWKNPEGEVKTFNTLVAWAIVKLQGEKFKGETLTPTPENDTQF